MQYSQNNIEQLFKAIGSIPGHLYSIGPEYDFIKTKNSIWPNQVINLKVNKDNIGKVIDQIKMLSGMGEIPSLLMLNPSTDQYSVIKKLKAWYPGFSTWTAMTHELTSPLRKIEIEDFKIRLVKTEEDLQVWLRIVEEELMGNQGLNSDIFYMLLSHAGSNFFLGFENGTPVATSFLFEDAKVGGVYLVSTRMAYRKKGIGKAMTNQALIKAKEIGCTKIDIQATELGKNVYASLGFVQQGLIHVFQIK